MPWERNSKKITTTLNNLYIKCELKSGLFICFFIKKIVHNKIENKPIKNPYLFAFVI